jgi:hypothetical protein
MKKTGESAQAIGNARFGQIVRGHFQSNPITDGEAHEMFAHSAGDMSEDLVLVIEFHPEHGPRQNGRDCALKFDCLLAGHSCFLPQAQAAVKRLRKVRKRQQGVVYGARSQPAAREGGAWLCLR